MSITTIEEKALLIAEIQGLVNKLYTFPQFKEYVRQGKLSMLDSRLETVDELIRRGLVTIPNATPTDKLIPKFAKLHTPQS